MDLDDLLLNFDSSAAIRLIRSQNAPLILSFLHHQFKRLHRVTIPHSELTEKLGDYLELLAESHPGEYTGDAQYYLRTWCDESHRFLRKYYDTDREDPVYELTPDTERALRWVEELQKGEFIGTESRFLRIFDLLEEIVTYSSENIEIRLSQLKAEKQKLQEEIDAIRATGKIEQYSHTQIKERFYEANDVARRLLSDFREVEENFRIIARQVQEKQLEVGVRKGSIVGHVLDADTALKESDQGRSFYAFWEFLISQSKQEHLRQLLEAVYHLPQIQTIDEDNQRLRRLKRNLIGAGTKIVDSNRKLSEQLRRLLDEKQLAEARRVIDLATEIKQLSLILTINGSEEEEPITIEAEPGVGLPFERQLWEPSQITNFAEQQIELGEANLTPAILATLQNLFHIDQRRLHRNIATLLESHPQISLAQIAESYPIQHGLAEVLTYFAIATKGEHHLIRLDESETLLLDSGSPCPRSITLPQVIFNRETSAQ